MYFDILKFKRLRKLLHWKKKKKKLNAQNPTETICLSRSPKSRPACRSGGSRASKIRHFTGEGVCPVPERPLFTLMTVFRTLFDASDREIPILLYTCSLRKAPLSGGASPYISFIIGSNPPPRPLLIIEARAAHWTLITCRCIVFWGLALFCCSYFCPLGHGSLVYSFLCSAPSCNWADQGDQSWPVPPFWKSQRP